MGNKHSLSIKQWIEKSTLELIDAGVPSPILDATILLETVLNKDKIWIILHDNYILSTSDLLQLDKHIQQRKKRVPLAYIIEAKEFYGRNFRTTPDVLIPRPESEEIISKLIEVVNDAKLNQHSNASLSVIDVGTGSGCLAITAKLELKQIQVIATDTSSSALKIARTNALSHDTSIEFINTSMVPKPYITNSSIILANLPYVPTSMAVSPEIHKEPSEAIFSSSRGLGHYKKLWKLIEQSDQKPIAIITESLLSQHSSMVLLAGKSGFTLNSTSGLAQIFKSS